MAENVPLTRGCLEEMVRGAEQVHNPVVQIINMKKIPSQSTDRYRMMVSDGEFHYSHVMLATQLNHLMDKEEVEPLSVVRVNKYLCNKIQNDKHIIIILDMALVKKGSEVGQRLGAPTLLKTDGTGVADKNANVDTAPPVKDTTPPRPPLNSARTFGGNSITTPPAMQVANSFAARGAPQGPSTPNRIHKINTLTPYQNRWRIRARVSQKANVRTWSNSKGEGRLFSVNFLDESGEIRATGFNEEVDRFYDLLEVNKVYYVSKCTLKTANKQYSNLKNDYEMTFNRETVIERCEEETDLPCMTFDFVPINELEKHQVSSNVDVIGVVKVCNDVGTVIGKQSQKEITKRDLTIVDQSGVAINCTLWGNDATTFDGSNNPVIAVKGARLSDFGGRSLSVLAQSQLIINPDTREGHILRGWFDREGRNMDFGSYRSEGPSGGHSTNWKTFSQVVAENLGHGEKPDYFNTKATVVWLKKDCMYPACPSENCNKKVVDQGNGMWRCEKCQREFPNHKWRMILQTTLSDHSGHQWVTAFQESAEVLLGVNADELGDMRQNSEAAFEQVFQQAHFKEYIFRLRTKVEVYNEESRLKTAVVSASPVDYVEYSKHLLQELGKMGL